MTCSKIRPLAVASLALLFAWLCSTPGPALGQQIEVSADDDQPSEATPELEIEEAEDRVKVDLELDEGGGRATIEAGALDYEPGRFALATGGVKVNYRGIKLQAQRARLDMPANRLTAEGQVVLDEGPQRLTGDVLEYDLEAGTGRMTNATAYVDPEYYFSGAEIVKTGPDTFTVTDGVFTSCSGDSPSWSFEMARAEVTLEDYARIKHARMKFKSLPVLYWPYILWPATTDRATGWLVPRPGYSDRRGAQLGLAYFKTFGRTADATLQIDLATKEFFGIGAQVRYAPSESTSGVLETYFTTEPNDAYEQIEVFDPDRTVGDDRWKFVYHHESNDLWNGWRGVVNLQQYSDFDYRKDIERDIDRRTTPFIYSNAFLSTNQGLHSFNALIDSREQVEFDGARDERKQLPEIEYRLRPLQLGGSQVYLNMNSSLNYFSVDLTPAQTNDVKEPETVSFDYGRADFASSISIPLSTLPWLSAKATLGGRVTHYTDSLDDPNLPEDTADDGAFSGRSLTRAFPQARLEMIGPSFSRIFDLGGERFSKLKHLIEPRFTYTWVDEFDDAALISRYDELDLVRPLNVGVVSIVNRLLAKPADEEEGSAYEIASLSIAQGVNFDDQPGQQSLDQTLMTSEGPIFTTLRVNPSEDSSIKLELQYNTLFDELQSFKLSGGTKFGPHAVGLTWYTNWAEPSNTPAGTAGFITTSDQATLNTSFQLVPRLLDFSTKIQYDLESSEILSQRHTLDLTSQCYSWQLEYRETTFPNFQDSEIRFSLALKNVGSFLDINESF